jgi:hypothetical protein
MLRDDLFRDLQGRFAISLPCSGYVERAADGQDHTATVEELPQALDRGARSSER